MQSLDELGRSVRALIGLDGSARAEAALLPATAIVQALSAPLSGALHLIQVAVPWLAATSDRPDASVSGMIDATILESNTYLQRLSRRVRERAPNGGTFTITWSVAVDTDIAQALLAAADAGASGQEDGVASEMRVRPYDLIALATHGRTGLQRWALGSITERVLHATRWPLLIVRVPVEVQEDSPFDDPLLADEIASWPDAQ
jgi:nucleotide-binding universal stress UspA family protein